MTKEQGQTVDAAKEWVEKEFGLNPSDIVQRWSGAKYYIPALLSIIDDLQKQNDGLTKERDGARMVADRHRDTVLMYMYGNQVQRDDFPEHEKMKHSWEKKNET